MLDFLKEEINTQQQKIKDEPEIKLNLSLEHFLLIFDRLNKLDFNEDYFKISSAKGRQRIETNFFITAVCLLKQLKMILNLYMKTRTQTHFFQLKTMRLSIWNLN